MLPLGKLPPDQLARLLSGFARVDASVLLGPGIGLGCAVLDIGGQHLLVAKSDPITFATDEIGWYAVHVNANDIATTGAAPRWFLVTILLPEGKSDAVLVESIFEQMRAACDEVGAALIGGHTEGTFGIDRPLVVGSVLGEGGRARLIMPSGARVGDVLVLTKSIAGGGTP